MRLRVATFNVWGLPWGLSRDLEPRTRAFCARLRGIRADVAAFQEVWTVATRDALVAAGRRAGLTHAWPPDAGVAHGGLLVLSRFPIAAARFEGYRVSGLAERVWVGDEDEGKGFVELRLDTPAGPLALIDTHLHAKYRRFVGNAYSAHRMAQVAQLAARVRELSGPLVLAGDLNLREDHPHYGVLTGLTGLRDAAVELDHRQATVLASNPYRYRASRPRRPARIDYVFVRDGAQRGLRTHSIRRIFAEPPPEEAGVAAYSDHAGLLAEVELVPEPRVHPAPDTGAMATVRRVLREGRQGAAERRSERRLLAGAGFAAGLTAVWRVRHHPVTRRQALRSLALLGGGVAASAGIGSAALAELVAGEEALGFEAVLRRLETSLDSA